MHIWHVDSAAGKSLTGNRSIFTNALECSSVDAVQFGDGAVCKVSGCGPVKLCSDWIPGGLTLPSVLFVPDATVNLISVHDTATAHDCTIAFDARGCTALKGDRVLWSIPVSSGGVYHFQSTIAAPALSAISSASHALAQLWHRRLGHPGSNVMRKLVRDKMLTGCDALEVLTAESFDSLCHSCHLGKAVRQPFPPSTRDVHACLELVHVDLMGPFKPVGPGDVKYVLTIIDDFSGYGEVSCLTSKTDVQDALVSVLNAWRNVHPHLTIGTLRSDRGGEFISQALGKWLRDRCIRHEFSISYSPQQNGKAERYGGVLGAKARTLLFDAQLPRHFWPFAFLTAAYLRNRNTYRDSSETPYQTFVGDRPDVSHLRVFGSTCYVTNIHPSRKKLDARAYYGKLVGYCRFSKGYCIWVPELDRVVESRDVVFHDDTPMFPIPGQVPLSDDGSPLLELSEIAEVPEPGVPVADLLAVNTSLPAGTSVSATQQLDNHSKITGQVGPSSPSVFDVDSSSTRDTAPVGNWVAVNVADALENPVPRDCVNSGGENVSELTLGVDLHAAFVTIPVEITYSQAIDASNAESDKWIAALEDEYQSLVANGTWFLVPRTARMRVIPCRWVFSHKLGIRNQVERYKCRLVAKGFMQRPGFEFTEVYAPVTTRTTLRYFLANVVSRKLILRQLDVKTAFLNGHLEEDLDIFMEQPEGYELGTNMVCKLVKAIYGLKQAPRAWHAELRRVLSLLQYHASLADPALFIRVEKDGSHTYVLTYVDDFNLAVSLLSVYHEIVKCMREAGWDVSEMGFPKQFLSLGISAVLDGDACLSIQIHQEAFIMRLLEKHNMMNCHPVDSPMAEGWEKHGYEGSPRFENQLEYSSLVGSLMYLSSCTRPDITFAVNILARSTHAPTRAHWEAAKRVLRYLKGSADLGLRYSHDTPVDLIAFSDASYAQDSQRRSTTGFTVLASGGAVSWNTRRQITVATSTSEAEYQAMSSTAREVSWLKQMRSDLGLPGGPVVICADNSAAIEWALDYKVDQKSKHIQVIHHFVREMVLSKKIVIHQVPTKDMVADALTKSLSGEKFSKFVKEMGMTRPL